MKSWQLNRKVTGLSNRMGDTVEAETRIDFNCLSEPERQLFNRIDEIIEEYKPATPPNDVIEKNADLWYKGLEIFGRRTMELFVEVMPASLCCDELEEWYFKIYFYNFWLDWLASIEQVRKMPKERREALICERKEMGMLDRVFRLSRNQPARKETRRSEPSTTPS